MSTWRYTLYGQCLILLIAGTCYGWDTNAWPAYLNSRAGRIHALNCASSVVEKADSVSGAPSTLYPSVSFWRLQRGNCIEVKEKLLEVSSATYSWTTNTTVSAVAIAANADANYPPNVDALIVSNSIRNKIELCQIAKVPTNFFEYTPYRGLDGVGPFTNDATVGHPHGWTNASTAAGGSVFPSGRSKWYTTDYGWDSVKAVANVLVRRVDSSFGAAWNDKTGYRSYVYESTNSFAEAKSFAEGSLTNGSAGTAWKSDVKYTAPYFYEYSINMPIYNYAYTWYTNGAEPFMACAFLTYTIVDSSGYVYDGNQIGYTNAGSWFRSNDVEYAYGWQTVVGTNTSAGIKTAYIGTTNFVPYAPASYPTNSGVRVVRGVGLRKANLFIDEMESIIFLDYTTDGGFKYK